MAMAPARRASRARIPTRPDGRCRPRCRRWTRYLQGFTRAETSPGCGPPCSCWLNVSGAAPALRPPAGTLRSDQASESWAWTPMACPWMIPVLILAFNGPCWAAASCRRAVTASRGESRSNPSDWRAAHQVCVPLHGDTLWLGQVSVLTRFPPEARQVSDPSLQTEPKPAGLPGAGYGTSSV